MKRALAFILCFMLSLAGLSADDRVNNVDFFILLDTSLSMQPAIQDAKNFVAGDVVGRLFLPGDWACVLEFYGQRSVLWKGDIHSDADTAALVRSIRALEADGSFTDIGAALDDLDTIVKERGTPDRPKYILLVTDERQEAPQGTRYYSSDYTVNHPLLSYIKREDHGSFRVITIGYGLEGRIEGESSDLIRTLSDPPARPSSPLAGSAQAALGQGSDGQSAVASELAYQPPEGASRLRDSVLWPVLGGAAVLLAGVIAVLWLRSRKRDDDGPGRTNAT